MRFAGAFSVYDYSCSFWWRSSAVGAYAIRLFPGALVEARAVALAMGTLSFKVVRTSARSGRSAISISWGVVALRRMLGLPLPWLRLSLIGADHYERRRRGRRARVGATLSDTKTLLTLRSTPQSPG
jgi:hypothetical protein